MERICFTMLIAPEHRATYARMHAEAWPELLAELDRTGWSNYSLFLRDDGLLVGYLESPDWQAAQREMSVTDVSARWSAEMDKLVVPGSTMLYPRLVHHLESPSAPLRHYLVVGSPVSLDPALLDAGLSNVSVFERSDGLTVIYAETGGAGILDWSPLADLAAQLG